MLQTSPVLPCTDPLMYIVFSLLNYQEFTDGKSRLCLIVRKDTVWISFLYLVHLKILISYHLKNFVLDYAEVQSQIKVLYAARNFNNGFVQHA